VGWWVRFLLWGFVLTIPCWMLANPYHALLRGTVSFLLGVQLPPRAPEDIEVHATQILGVFVALCLASVRAPLKKRVRAIALGLPALFGIELLTGLIAIQAGMLVQAGHGLPEPVMSFLDVALLAPPWVGAPVLWLLLLGRQQLPRLRLRESPAGTR